MTVFLTSSPTGPLDGSRAVDGLDGRRLFEDITYPDSRGHEFLAIPDGSYVWIEDGRAVLWGEGWRIADGQLTQICAENETLELGKERKICFGK